MQTQVHFIQQLQYTLQQPVIRMHDWFKLFNGYLIFIANTTPDTMAYKTRCHQAHQHLLHQLHYPALINVIHGLVLADWCQLVCHVVLHAPLPIMLGHDYCLALLSFHGLFIQTNHQLSFGLLDHGADTLPMMIEIILKNHFFNPYFNQAYPTWLASDAYLKKHLPKNIVGNIYAFLFMPHYAQHQERQKLFDALTQWLDQSHYQLNQPQAYLSYHTPMQLAKTHLIKPQALLSYLLRNEHHTVADVLTAIMPLPMALIESITMGLANLEQKQSWINTLMAYCVTSDQKKQLIQVLSHSQHSTKTRPSTDITERSYCIDRCRLVHQKNIQNQARRQKQIQYLVSNPLTLYELTTILSHFNVRIKHLAHWLHDTTIDHYDYPKDMDYEQLSSITNGYPGLDAFIIARMTGKEDVVELEHTTLTNYYLAKVSAVLNEHSRPLTSWWGYWLSSSVRCNRQVELVNKLKSMQTELMHETDFTHSIAQLRSYTEKNSCSCCSENLSLFQEIKRIGHETAMLRHDSFNSKYIR